MPVNKRAPSLLRRGPWRSLVIIAVAALLTGVGLLLAFRAASVLGVGIAIGGALLGVLVTFLWSKRTSRPTPPRRQNVELLCLVVSTTAAVAGALVQIGTLVWPATGNVDPPPAETQFPNTRSARTLSPTTPEPEAGSQPATFYGTWNGTIIHHAGHVKRYPIRMTLRPGHLEDVIGVAWYERQRCRKELLLRDVRGSAIYVEERFLEQETVKDPRDECAQHSLYFRLIADTPDQLRIDYFDESRPFEGKPQKATGRLFR